MATSTALPLHLARRVSLDLTNYGVQRIPVWPIDDKGLVFVISHFATFLGPENVSGSWYCTIDGRVCRPPIPVTYTHLANLRLVCSKPQPDGLIFLYRQIEPHLLLDKIPLVDAKNGLMYKCGKDPEIIRKPKL